MTTHAETHATTGHKVAQEMMDLQIAGLFDTVDAINRTAVRQHTMTGKKEICMSCLMQNLFSTVAANLLHRIPDNSRALVYDSMVAILETIPGEVIRNDVKKSGGGSA